MAKRKRAPSRGPVRVGLLALHDKKFFARLLEDPRKAMEAAVSRGRLKLTKADMLKVEKLIRHQLTLRPDKNYLVMFGEYQRRGVFNDDRDWALLWKPT